MTFSPCSQSAWLVSLLAVAVAACSPPLDWREFVPEGSGIGVTFPCRPDRLARQVVVAEVAVTMQLLVCSAGTATYALGFFDVEERTHVAATLNALKTSAVANLAGQGARWSALQINGMTPNDQAGRLTISGHRPDGKLLVERAAFFVHGLRVYQATVIQTTVIQANGVGKLLLIESNEATAPFFRGLKFPS